MKALLEFRAERVAGKQNTGFIIDSVPGLSNAPPPNWALFLPVPRPLDPPTLTTELHTACPRPQGPALRAAHSKGGCPGSLASQVRWRGRGQGQPAGVRAPAWEREALGQEPLPHCLACLTRYD